MIAHLSTSTHSTLIWALLMLLNPCSALGALVSGNYHDYRIHKRADTSESVSAPKTKKNAKASATTTSTSRATSTSATSNTDDSSSFHSEGIIGICFLTFVLVTIIFLVARSYRQNQRGKALEAEEEARQEMIQKARPSAVNSANLPDLPPSPSSASPLVAKRPKYGPGSARWEAARSGTALSVLLSESDSVLRTPSARSVQSLRTITSEATIVAEADVTDQKWKTAEQEPQLIVSPLPNPFEANSARAQSLAPHAAQARSRTLPPIHTSASVQPLPRSVSQDDEDIIVYQSSSFLESTPTLTPKHHRLHRSLAFSDALTATANGNEQTSSIQTLPEVPPSPSQWLGQSPTASRRTSTMLQDMMEYQTWLEANDGHQRSTRDFQRRLEIEPGSASRNDTEVSAPSQT